jgi:hypothetical protein
MYKMASQPSDTLSALESDQFSEFEGPDSLEPTPSSSSLGIRLRKRTWTSKIWDYTPGAFEEEFFNSIRKPVWRCKFCHKEFVETSGTCCCIPS